MLNTLTATICALAFLGQVEAPQRAEREFWIQTDSSGRFLALQRKGNKTDRTAYVTVLEYLGEGRSLRKLYETKLLNKERPIGTTLSRDGRFYLTFDKFVVSETSPGAVVIYDLARNEHTAYGGKDFLSEEVINTLIPHGFIPGPKWRGKDNVFNQDSTKYYPTLPENCKEERVPFLVIDLPSRTISIQPHSAFNPKDIVVMEAQQWGWIESAEIVPTNTTMLPARMTWSCAGYANRVLDLSPDKTEYLPRKAPKEEQQK